jgi:hypothetical protein
MKLTKPPRAAFSGACTFAHRGFRIDGVNKCRKKSALYPWNLLSQELLRQRDVSTTIYTHALNGGRKGYRQKACSFPISSSVLIIH